MTIKEILENKKITSSEHALLVLKNIDFERLQQLNLDTKVVLYLSGCGDKSMTATYAGKISVKDENIFGYTNLRVQSLPAPKYFVNNNKLKEFEYCKTVPCQSLFSKPALLEFIIEDTATNGNKGLIAFRDIVIPALFSQGYTQTNNEHTSVFWFHAGKGNTKEYLISISMCGGLRISKTEVDGIKVFTEQDVKRFLELIPEKK